MLRHAYEDSPLNLGQAMGREPSGALKRSWEAYRSGVGLSGWESSRERDLRSDMETKILRILGRRALTCCQVCLRLNNARRQDAKDTLAELVKRGVVEEYYEQVGKSKWWYRVKRQTEGA